VEVDPDGDLLSWTERCGHLQRVVGDDYAAEAPGDGLARAVWRSIVDRAVVKPAGWTIFFFFFVSFFSLLIFAWTYISVDFLIGY